MGKSGVPENPRLSGGEYVNIKIRHSVLEEIKNNRWDEYKKCFPQYNKSDIEENMFALSTWEPACQWSILQVEEMFCDFLGICLFAESYLHAFMYLLAPGTSGQRSVGYPNMEKRISYLTDAAKEQEVDVPTEFAASFIRETEPSDPTTKFLVSIADTVSESCLSDILKTTRKFGEHHNAPSRNADRVNQIADQFKKWVVPTAQQETLVDILCATWKCNLDEHLWAHVSQFEQKDWQRVLRDLAFKSMEVSEVCERLQKAARSRKTS